MTDVAAVAGVSLITVSRALRTPEKVAPETLARITSAISELGYVPNLIASSLASRRSNVVAAVIPNVSNPLFSSAIEALSDGLRAAGYYLMIGNSGQSLEEEQAVVSAFLHQRPCAMFLHQTRHSMQTRQMLRRTGIPVVEVGDLVRSPIDMVVSYSNREAGKAMTRYLLESGRTRIAFVSSPYTDRSRQRRAGFGEALAERHLEVDPALDIELPSKLGSGELALERLLPHRPDAILFNSALAAAGAIMTSQRRRLRVPIAFAVAAFDDNELAVEVTPSLTTIRFPRAEVGERAAALLLTRLKGEMPDRRRNDLGFELIRRDSA